MDATGDGTVRYDPINTKVREIMVFRVIIVVYVDIGTSDSLVVNVRCIVTWDPFGHF